MELFSDNWFMQEALKEAEKAYAKDEVPVGAIVVLGNKIIARAHNLTEQLTDVTAHAEMQAITAAAHALGGKYLNECSLYVTLEPCAMCAGALSWAQLGKLFIGANDESKGAISMQLPLFHPKTIIVQGLMANECKVLLKNFFKHKRK